LPLRDKYLALYDQVYTNKVIDQSSYYEFYTYSLFSEVECIKKYGKIIPNFKIKNNKPISHAIPGVADIEIFLNEVSFIVECTVKLGIAQFDDEHESVSRHYEDFNKKNIKKYKSIFGLFVCQKLSDDLRDWLYEYFEEVKVIPLTSDLLIKFTSKIKSKKIEDIEILFNQLINLKTKSKSSKEWIDNIKNYIGSVN